MDVIQDIQAIMVRELNTLKEEIELFPDEELLWQTISGISNSAGNLALHICGNLNHYIGKILGNTDYVRNRDGEFNSKNVPKKDLLTNIDETIAVLNKVLPDISETTLNSPYPKVVGSVKLSTLRFIIHLGVHLGFHLGQIGYLRRIISGNNKSCNPLSLKNIGIYP